MTLSPFILKHYLSPILSKAIRKAKSNIHLFIQYLKLQKYMRNLPPVKGKWKSTQKRLYYQQNQMRISKKLIK